MEKNRNDDLAKDVNGVYVKNQKMISFRSIIRSLAVTYRTEKLT